MVGGVGGGARIMVVDDDPGLLALIEMRLTAVGYAVSCAASGNEALERFPAERPRAVITDLRMDGIDGHALFARLHTIAPTVPVIMLTAHGTIPDAVAATQRGVFDFLTKPFDSNELLSTVAEAMAISPEVDGKDRHDASWRADIVSSSLVMNELLRQARRAADADTPVLISGPRGSAKETLARAIHAASRRKKKPFIAIRCGELASLKSDTSPLDQLLSTARGGALMLDDIEDLPALEQARLLPLVRERIPFSAPTRIDTLDIRVVATTRQPLDQAIRDGRFRADLFYALGRTLLSMPALSERREDIPVLVSHFIARSQGHGRGVSPEAMAILQEAAWPGNVRQLRNIIQQALALSVTPQVPATLVRRLLQEESGREVAALDEARRAFEYDYLADLLKTTCGNVSHAARVARRNRTEFYKLLARHHIDPGNYK
ncbi:MAG: response regulator [Proteobacteria bacterium]|nr:response regulator [Pseudomonadota bacterium]